MKAWRNWYDYVLLVLALIVGGYAVFTLRQPWARRPEGDFLWWLLIISGLAGGYALLRMDRWLPDASPLAQPGLESEPARLRRGVYCLLAASGLTAWVILRLWPDYHQWSGAVLPWMMALVLACVGSGLIGAVGQSPILDWRSIFSSRTWGKPRLSPQSLWQTIRDDFRFIADGLLARTPGAGRPRSVGQIPRR